MADEIINTLMKLLMPPVMDPFTSQLMPKVLAACVILMPRESVLCPMSLTSSLLCSLYTLDTLDTLLVSVLNSLDAVSASLSLAV